MPDKKRILSFGGGLQTTALAILAYKKEVKVDAAIFADTGAEKPETYWYMAEFMAPLFKEMNVPLTIIKNDQPYYQPDLYGFLWRIQDIPSLRQRRCTDHFKIRPIKKYAGKDCIMLIGFSLDEAYRAKRGRWKYQEHPLIELRMTAQDCHRVITDFGLPVPLKSSCYICPFQRPTEWNWLKNHHPDLFTRALELEANYHKRKPHMRGSYGLLSGTPLRKLAEGLQPEMFQCEERSCWSGYCGH